MPFARTALIVQIGLAVALALLWVRQAREQLFWQADFSMLYSGWSMVLDGEGQQLYDLDLQTEYQHRLIPERGPEGGLLPFNHPPHAVVPLALLAFLPRDVAFFTWTGVQLFLLVVWLGQLRRLAGPLDGEATALLLASIVAFPGVFVTFQMGQVSLLIAVALTGFVLALRARHTVATAAWFVLGTLKPHFFLIPGLILLLWGRWRALGLALVVFLLWAGLGTLFLGARVWMDWLAVVRLTSVQAGQLGVFPQAMYNVKGLLFGLLGVEHLTLINALALVALVLALGVVVWLNRIPSDAYLAVSLLLGFLTNPHVNPADTVVYVAPAVLGWSVRRSAWLTALLVSAPLVLVLDLYALPVPPVGVRPFLVLVLLVTGTLLMPSRTPKQARAVSILV